MRMWSWPLHMPEAFDWLHLLENNVRACLLKVADEINPVPRSVGVEHISKVIRRRKSKGWARQAW